jgi:DNA-directed RNA polymerase subunit RPC12/RpoP
MLMKDTTDQRCPLCDQTVYPADGVSVNEHLARGIITKYAELQSEGERDERTCPRCGYKRMLQGVMRNALSRHFDIYICPECGNDEAIRVYKKSILPAESWYIVQEILNFRYCDSGDDGEDS